MGEDWFNGPEDRFNRFAVNGVLTTRNHSDFRLVPDLHIEDWSIEET